MPTYPYYCKQCENNFDVIKPISSIDDDEFCKGCNIPAERRIALVNFYGANDWQGSYNPAFGRFVRSKAHQREILAEYKGAGREFIEVGTEPVENVHKHYDAQREKARDDRWNESAEKIIQETLR